MNYKEIIEHLNKKEDELLLNYPLLIIDGKVNSKVNLKKFLQILINNYVNYYDTLNSITKIKTDDKELHRSTKDLFLICKYYKPKTTLISIIYNLCKLSDERLIANLPCGNIDQRVWFNKEMPFSRGHHDYKFIDLYEKRIDKIIELDFKTIKQFYKEYEQNK